MRVRPRTGLLAGLAVVTALSTAFAGAASASPLSSKPASQPAAGGSRTLAANTRFYVNPASEAARQALTDLTHHDLAAAATMARLASWPEAIWFTKGTPSEVNVAVAA